MEEANEALEAKLVDVHFEGLVALDGVTLKVGPREIVGLIGPNGAGKTTLVNVLSGFQTPDGGTVFRDGENITGHAPHRLARSGIARTFQGARLFGHLTVAENLEVAAVGAGLGLKAARQRRREILGWFGLSERAGHEANTLAHGDERRVGIARALSSRPKYLLLDEPAGGLNDAECRELMSLVQRIPKDFECGVLVIEHNMQVIMGVCERIYVLDSGRVIAEGSVEQIKTNQDVVRAYLGTTDL